MRKKFFKIFIAILCVVSLLSVANFVFVNHARADSGWDSDFDLGGSDWGGGSDWDSSSHGYASSAIGSIIAANPLFFTILLFSFIIFLCIKMSRGIKSSTAMPLRLSNDQIHQVDSKLDIEEFKKLGYDIYKEIQYAWMNFDYDKLRQLTTDEIYNMYSMQLDTLQVKAEKNIMSDFVLVDSYISNIYIQNNVETIEFILKTNFYDYVVDSSNKVVRGSDKFKLELTYKLTFVKIVGPNDNNYCPNCGAKLEDKASTECPYCKSVIVSDNYTWVMSKKQSLGQRRI